MAAYKVPQDVEADDKLIGPFSFRQFIYLIIVVISGFIGWLLAQIFIGLIIVPLPAILLFGALALPLRKDQPMETYLAAVVRFFLKPKKRMWQPDGQVNLVEIIAPKVIEQQRFKDLSQDDAQDRFSYLAQVMDTRGWSTRGVTSGNDALNDNVVAEANTAQDVLDTSNSVSQDFNALLEQEEQKRRQDAMLRMQQAKAALAAAQASAADNPATAAQPTAAQTSAPLAPAPTAAATTQPASSAAVPPQSAAVDDAAISYKPYPTMHQHVLSPAGGTSNPSASPKAAANEPTITPAKDDSQTAVPTPVSPDIIKLANNSDLSISAIAREAHRLEDHDDNEVVINLH